MKLEKIPDERLFELLTQILEKVDAEETVDKKDYNMVLTVTAASLARAVENHYLEIINGRLTHGSNTGKQSKKEGGGDSKTA
jgi:hypothetical protein